MKSAAQLQRALNRIRQVAARVDDFKIHLDSQRYSWLNKENLTKEVDGFEAKFLQKNKTEDSLEGEKVKLIQKKQELYRWNRIWIYLMNIVLETTGQKNLRPELIFADPDILIKAQNMIRGVKKNNLLKSVPEIDLENLLKKFESVVMEYSKINSNFLKFKEGVETETQKFLDCEEGIMDLYFSVVNALEGALHNHKDELLVLCPWKKKRKKTNIEIPTEPEK